MRYILLLLLLCGCATQKKAEDFYKLHPEKLAKECMDKFPVDTVFKQGAVVIKSDTTIIKGDSVECPPVINGVDTVIVKVKCPDNIVIRDTITRIDTITKLDNAALAYITYERDDLIKKLDKSTAESETSGKRAKNRLWVIIGLAVFLAGSIYLNFKK